MLVLDAVNKIYQPNKTLKLSTWAGFWRHNASQLKQSPIFVRRMKVWFFSAVVAIKFSNFLFKCPIFTYSHQKNAIPEPTNDNDDDLSDAESVHDYEQDSNNSSAMQSDKLPIEILEPIKSFGLVEKLWQRAQPLAENVNDILMDHGKSLYKK